MAHRLTRAGWLTFALIASLLASIMVAAPGDAAQPDDRILYSARDFSDSGTTSFVETVRADGADVRTLRSLATNHIGGTTWSPDGSRVLYSIPPDPDPGPATGLWVVNADGSGATRISETASYEVDWSPAGTEIVFATSNSDTGAGTLHLIPASGGTAQVLTTGAHGIFSPVFSPDGSRIAYEQMTSSDWPPASVIRTIGRDGTGIHDVAGPGAVRHPRWSPDGDRISFRQTGDDIYENEIRVAPAAGGGASTALVEPAEMGAHTSLGSHQWSPDGSRIVFNATQAGIGSYDSNLYTVTTSGSGTVAPLLISPEEISDFWPTWAPDGSSVAFVRGLPNPMGPGHLQNSIWLVDADGTNPRKVTDGHDDYSQPSFAPRAAAPGDTTKTAPVAPAGDGTAQVTLGMPAGPVIIDFAGLSGGGTVSVTQRAPTAGEQGPGFTALPVAFDISLDGATFGAATVCVPFDASQAAAAGLQPEELRLYHIAADGVRRDVTTSVDMAAGRLCGSVTSFSPFLVGLARLERYSGRDRTATAAAVSAASFAPGTPVAYVATQFDYPDALAGGPAAARAGGPILLVSRTAIPDATAAELTRLNPGRIVVLGGNGVVDPQVQAALAAYTDGPVERLSGPNRYATAAAISAAHFEPGAQIVYVATGLAFPDALAGGAAAAADGAAVLLVTRDSVPDATAGELQRLGPERIVVLGGTGAVSDATLDALRPYASSGVDRVFGRTRFETAAAVAARFETPTDRVFIATGTAFPDALTAVPAAGVSASPVILVAPTSLPEAAAVQLDRLDPDRIAVMGGRAAVAPELEAPLAGYLR